MSPSTSQAVTAAPPAVARRPVPPHAASAAAGANPDAPVRVDVEMPRDLFDRLTDYDDAPRCRYDMATGRAEFVAEPGPAHEGRSRGAGYLFLRVMDALAASGRPVKFFPGGATRLLSDDGAFEPDESFYIEPPDAPDLMEFDGCLDVRKGHPVPDVVVEIDRSASSRDKLAPYFRMGVREAWTWSRTDGARIWVADPRAEDGFDAADRSAVLTGLGRDDLDRLLASRDTVGVSRELADRVARAMLAGAAGSRYGTRGR